MTPISAKSPVVEANRLSKLLNISLGTERFPVDVEQLALQYAGQFGYADGINVVVGRDLPGFEGALYKIEQQNKPGWALLYNSSISAPGRIRFTIAHELGHYILHRSESDSFQCGQEDMLYWASEERRIEAEADTFASYLLMPLDDFRREIDREVTNLDVLARCAGRYGISLTAVILKWLEFTTQRAVLVMSRDGYVMWAKSSGPAFNSGAYLKTRGSPLEVPVGSLAAAGLVLTDERQGIELDAQTWFPREPKDMSMREIRITSDRYDLVMSLLLLPRTETRSFIESIEDEKLMLDEHIRSGHFSKR